MTNLFQFCDRFPLSIPLHRTPSCTHMHRLLFIVSGDNQLSPGQLLHYFVDRSMLSLATDYCLALLHRSIRLFRQRWRPDKLRSSSRHLARHLLLWLPQRPTGRAQGRQGRTQAPTRKQTAASPALRSRGHCRYRIVRRLHKRQMCLDRARDWLFRQ